MLHRFFYLSGCFLIGLALAMPALSAEPPTFAAPVPARTLLVGGGAALPPYEFFDSNRMPTGYDVELLQAVADVMGMKVEFQLDEWSLMRQKLHDGDVDILEGMFFSEARLNEVDFSLPHTTVHHTIFARQGSPDVRSIEELRGKKIIVHRGSLMHDYLAQHKLLENSVFIEDPAQALRQLAAGNYDYAVLPLLPGIYLSRELKLTNIEPVIASIMSSPYCFAVRKGNTELLAQLNEGLAIIKQTGRYQEIYEKWLGVEEPARLDWQTVASYAALIIGPLLLLLGAVVLWSRMLRRQVALRTADLEREIGERRHAEEELRLNQKQLVQADKMAALGVLVSGVAHEVNNPNGLMLLNLPLLRKALNDTWPILEEYYQSHGDFTMGGIAYSEMRQEIPRMLDDMQSGAQRIKHIVNDLKNFARRDDTGSKERIDLNAIVRMALRLVDTTLRKSTDHVEVHYGQDLPAIFGNAQRIEQVVVNLVLNACQALPDRSRGITITTTYQPAERHIRLEVRDEGSGIAPENLSRLTDPFFTTKREQGGTGLGLSVSFGIVKEHGGTLHFASTLNQGTTVTLTFPVFEGDTHGR